MSTILKALRRLEEDKRAQASMSLEDAVLEPASPPRRPAIGVLVVTGSMLVVGLAAVMWATSSLWLPGSAALDGENGPQPVASSPPTTIRIEDAPRPPPTTPVPLRKAASHVEAFENPTRTRREMQRLAGASPEASDALEEEAPAEPAKIATPRQTVAKASPPPSPAPAPVAAPVPRADEPSIASVGPVEIIERRAVPQVEVREISWHPSPERREAVFHVEGESSPVRMGEGGRVAGFTIAEIGISDVELVRDGVALRRRVGTN